MAVSFSIFIELERQLVPATYAFVKNHKERYEREEIKIKRYVSFSLPVPYIFFLQAQSTIMFVRIFVSLLYIIRSVDESERDVENIKSDLRLTAALQGKEERSEKE